LVRNNGVRPRLARAEWAIEDATPEVTAQELRIATAHVMLAWLKANCPQAPIWYDYASVLGDFEAEATSAKTKSIFQVQYRAANLNTAFRGTHRGPATGLAVWAQALASSEEVLIVLGPAHGAVRALEGEMQGEEQCGD
jgi:hypothetical protein